jgi:hypothetical protein
MIRRSIPIALMLSTLCLPLHAIPSTPPPEATPRVRLAVTFALVSDMDLKAAHISLRAVHADRVIISHQPWGEARLQHLDLQVSAGEDAVRLLTALGKVHGLGETTLNTVSSGSETAFVHSQQVDTVVFDEKAGAAQKQAVPPKSTPATSPPPHQYPRFLRFSLRPLVNADGTISLGFAPSQILTVTKMSPSTVSAGEPQDTGVGFTEVGRFHSGETVALTGMFDGPRLGGAEVVAFVTPTLL